MPQRKPLVLGSDGLPQQAQAGDTVSVASIFTSASIALPVLTAPGGSFITVPVSPRVTGDSLAAGEPISVTPSAALPGGLGIAYAVATASNTVQIGFVATISVTASSRAWTVVAHR